MMYDPKKCKSFVGGNTYQAVNETWYSSTMIYSTGDNKLDELLARQVRGTILCGRRSLISPPLAPCGLPCKVLPYIDGGRSAHAFV